MAKKAKKLEIMAINEADFLYGKIKIYEEMINQMGVYFLERV